MRLPAFLNSISNDPCPFEDRLRDLFASSLHSLFMHHTPTDQALSPPPSLSCASRLLCHTAPAMFGKICSMKTCNLCHQQLPPSAFQRKSSRPDGLSPTCRTCDNARRTQRRIDKGLRRPDPAPGYKWCSKCEVEKPLTEFYARLSGPQQGKTHAHCKICTKADNVARARRRGVHARQNPDPLAVRRAKLAHYNLTIEDYDRMLAEQNSTCPGCGTQPNGKNFSVDHDHSCCSGSKSCGTCIRGLLCNSCNLTIGNAQDSPETLRQLATYLDAFEFAKLS